MRLPRRIRLKGSQTCSQSRHNNTLMALISVWVSGGLALSTWLMRSYFESLPQELFDAAYGWGGGAAGFRLCVRAAGAGLDAVFVQL